MSLPPSYIRIAPRSLDPVSFPLRDDAGDQRGVDDEALWASELLVQRS